MIEIMGNASKPQPQSPYQYEDLPSLAVPLKSSDKNDQLNLALTLITMGPSIYEDLEAVLPIAPSLHSISTIRPARPDITFTHADMNALLRLTAVRAEVALLITSALVQDDTPLQVPYRQVLTEYFKDASTASRKCDGRRLVFKGQVYLLSDDSLNILAVTEDLKVGASFQDDQRDALRVLFPDHKLTAYKPSKDITLDYLNRHFVGLTLALADCRVGKL